MVGCGDVGLRVVRQHPGGARRWIALTSDPARVGDLRRHGMVPLVGDLDRPGSLRRLAGLATRVLHLAPPPSQGDGDPRTRALLASLARAMSPVRSAVYVSTTGVYGDCQGAWVGEWRLPMPATARARRRVDAERRMRRLAWHGVRVSILRAPGIYALDRAQGTPRRRLEQAVPVLRAEDDVYTNHIHADDLARACWLALWRARTMRVFNANDDTVMRMGEYFDCAAQIFGLSQPPRVSRAAAERLFGEARMGFLRESRRLLNRRIKSELRLQLRYPTVQAGLTAGAAIAATR